MTTAELAFQQSEIEWLVAETQANTWLSVIGPDDRGMGLCPYVTFYVHHQRRSYMAVAEKFISIWERFAELRDEPFKHVFKSRTQVWLKPTDKRFPPDLRAEAEYHYKERESYYLKGTDGDSPDESPRWSYAARVTHVPTLTYSTLKLVFRHKWYAEGNQERWKEFVRDCVRLLRPDQCYMGYEVGNGNLSVMSSYEADVLERICADHFYGMDIDHPSTMGFHYFDPIRKGNVNPCRLGAGLRAPTWCFMLSPAWQRKLGKGEAQIRAELADPRIRITAIPFARSALNPEGANGLWIELGELDLYPVAQGVPELLAKANRLIQPIRCNDLRLISLDPWDDDPNPRFDFESTPLWMGRFDEGSAWTSQALPMFNGQALKGQEGI